MSKELKALKEENKSLKRDYNGLKADYEELLWHFLELSKEENKKHLILKIIKEILIFGIDLRPLPQESFLSITNKETNLRIYCSTINGYKAKFLKEYFK